MVVRSLASDASLYYENAIIIRAAEGASSATFHRSSLNSVERAILAGSALARRLGPDSEFSMMLPSCFCTITSSSGNQPLIVRSAHAISP